MEDKTVEQTFNASEIDILYQSLEELSPLISSNFLSEEILSKVLNRACKENNLQIAEKFFTVRPDLMKDERLSLAFLTGSFRVFFFYLEKNDFLMEDLIHKALMSACSGASKTRSNQIKTFLRNFYELAKNILKNRIENQSLSSYNIETIVLSENIVSGIFFSKFISSGFLSEETLATILRNSCIFDKINVVKIFHSLWPDFLKEERLKMAFLHGSIEVVRFYLSKNDPWEYEYVSDIFYDSKFFECLDLADKPAKKPVYIDSRYSTSNSSDLLCIACHDGNYSSYQLIGKAKVKATEFHLALAIKNKNFQIATNILQMASCLRKDFDFALVEKLTGPINYFETPSFSNLLMKEKKKQKKKASKILREGNCVGEREETVDRVSVGFCSKKYMESISPKYQGVKVSVSSYGEFYMPMGRAFNLKRYDPASTKEIVYTVEENQRVAVYLSLLALNLCFDTYGKFPMEMFKTIIDFQEREFHDPSVNIPLFYYMVCKK